MSQPTRKEIQITVAHLKALHKALKNQRKLNQNASLRMVALVEAQAIATVIKYLENL